MIPDNLLIMDYDSFFKYEGNIKVDLIIHSVDEFPWGLINPWEKIRENMDKINIKRNKMLSVNGMIISFESKNKNMKKPEMISEDEIVTWLNNYDFYHKKCNLELARRASCVFVVENTPNRTFFKCIKNRIGTSNILYKSDVLLNINGEMVSKEDVKINDIINIMEDISQI